MATSPTGSALSDFEQLEIVRAELKVREPELAEVERRIHDVDAEARRREFLRGLAPYYADLGPGEGEAEMAGLERSQALLAAALEVLRRLVPELEARIAGGGGAVRPRTGAPRPLTPPAGPSRPGAGPGRTGDSFESFRHRRMSGET